MKERNVTGISISLKTGSNAAQLTRAQYLTSTTMQAIRSHGPVREILALRPKWASSSPSQSPSALGNDVKTGSEA